MKRTETDPTADIFEDQNRYFLNIEELLIPGTQRYSDPVTPHSHEYYSVMLLTEAAGKIVIDYIPYELIPGRVILLGPAHIHNWEKVERLSGKEIRFGTGLPGKIFSEDQLLFYTRFLNSVYNLPFVDLPAVVFGKINELPSLLNIFSGVPAVNNEHLKAPVLALIITILAEFALPRYKSRNSRQREQFQKFIFALEDNYKSKKNSEFYCQALGISYQRLNRLCHQITGRAIKQLINERVLLEARRMLVYSAMHIADIANDLGYEDPAYFTRNFKKHLHEAPSDFKTTVKHL